MIGQFSKNCLLDRWFLEPLEAGTAVGNLPAAVRLAGNLDVVAQNNFLSILGTEVSRTGANAGDSG